MKGRIKYQVMNGKELDLFTGSMERLLTERGIEIDHPEILRIMGGAGCRVTEDHIWFTGEVIARAVAAVPEEFVLAAQDERYDLKFPHPEGDFYTRTNTGAPFYKAPGGEKHYGTLEDVEEWYHLTNQLENIDFVALPSACDESIPAKAIDVCALEKALCFSRKHIWIQPYETPNVKHLIEMCQRAAGGAEKLRERPIVSFISCSVPVLKFKYMDAEILYRCAVEGIPVQPCALPTAGANTPVTAQGTALAACADVLAQIVILETICPGLPVIATPLLFSMDMMTTMTLQSNTEITLGRLLCMQAFEEGYNIRCHSYGTGTDSHLPDGQDMIERTSLIQAMAMSDASVLGGAGQMETAMTLDPVQLVIDDEIFGIARRLRGGLAVDEETLDLQELLEGNDEKGYLKSRHTRKHYREVSRPKLFYLGKVGKHDDDGTRTMLERAEEKYRKLLETEYEPVLDETTMNEVHRIAEEAVSALMGGEKS